MKKLLSIFIVLLMAFSLSGQVAVWGPNAGKNAVAEVWSSTGTDTSKTSPPIYFSPNYKTNSGDVTLAGLMQVSAGADTITTVKCRLIMARESAIAGKTPMYDKNDWHTISAAAGDYLPAEDAVTSTAHEFSVYLNNQNWWKPCIGVQFQFIHNQKSGMTKKIEPYLIYIYYEQ